MNLIKELRRLLSRRPLVLAWFDESFTAGLLESRNGMDRFTFTQRHSDIEGLKAPTLCIAQLQLDAHENECFVGVLSRRATVSTFDTRLTFTNLRKVQFRTFAEIAPELTKRGYERRFYDRISHHGMVTIMSEKLGLHVIETVAARNAKEVIDAINSLPDFRQLEGAAWEQKDAIYLAQSIFGLSASDRASTDSQESPDEDEAGSHLLEDNVIAADASEVPGFSLITKHLTGRSDFRKGDERLTIYTANRGPIEAMLGVDLVYINEVVGNIVMVQYKMLEQQSNDTATDWVFRPDSQLKAEMRRMILPQRKKVAFDDYRLHRDPFFLKFVKRKLVPNSDQAFVVSLAHLEQLLKNKKFRGPKGGVRISYQSLGGNYLRQNDLIGLIRSGYVGTHRIESDSLKPFLSALNRGDRGVVVAWQRKAR